MKPNFLVIGAAKCATTSLVKIFSQHPQMFVTTPKEPEFFSYDEVFARGVDWYEALFAGGFGRIAVGEGSTGYTKQIDYPLAAERVARHLPEAKLIYIVRHPLQRIESHWLQRAADGEEMPPLAGALQKWPGLLDTSKYWKQIRAYRSRYGDERILVLFFEDFVRQPEVEIARCYQFLGVDPKLAGADPATPHNVSSAKGMDGPVLRWLRRSPIVRRSPVALKIGKLAIGLARARLPFLQHRLPPRPEWPADLRREVVRQIKDDAGEFLRFYGQSADFWRLE